MNRTIYIRDEDVPVWDRAKELAGEKLAPVIVDGLKRFIVEKEAAEAEARGFERIEISFNDSDDHNIPRKKAFTGRWIFPLRKPVQAGGEDSDIVACCAVAVTPRGSAVLHRWTSGSEGCCNYKFFVFESLEQAARDEWVGWAARAAIREIGVPVEELDI